MIEVILILIFLTQILSAYIGYSEELFQHLDKFSAITIIVFLGITKVFLIPINLLLKIINVKLLLSVIALADFDSENDNL